MKRISGIGRRGLLKLSAGAAGAMGLAAPAIAQRRARTLRFGAAQATTTKFYNAMQMFSEQVGKLSSNQMKMDIFPASQLGGIPQMLSATQAGTLSMTMATGAWYSNYVPAMDVFSLPFLVGADLGHLRKALQGSMGDTIRARLQPVKFQVLDFWVIGGRHMLNNVRPLAEPADFKGLKMRSIASKAYYAMFRALGANPITMNGSELYLALQQHVIDGYEYDLPDVVGEKHYEVCKYLSMTYHNTDFFIISMNKDTWDGLAAEEQGILKQALSTASDYEWVAQPADIDVAYGKLKKLMTVNDLTDAQRQDLQKATRPIFADFNATIGKDIIDQAIRELS